MQIHTGERYCIYSTYINMILHYIVIFTQRKAFFFLSKACRLTRFILTLPFFMYNPLWCGEAVRCNSEISPLYQSRRASMLQYCYTESIWGWHFLYCGLDEFLSWPQTLKTAQDGVCCLFWSLEPEIHRICMGSAWKATQSPGASFKNRGIFF